MHREQPEAEPDKAGERDAGQHVERPALIMETRRILTRMTFFFTETV